MTSPCEDLIDLVWIGYMLKKFVKLRLILDLDASASVPVPVAYDSSAACCRWGRRRDLESLRRIRELCTLTVKCLCRSRLGEPLGTTLRPADAASYGKRFRKRVIIQGHT